MVLMTDKIGMEVGDKVKVGTFLEKTIESVIDDNRSFQCSKCRKNIKHFELNEVDLHNGAIRLDCSCGIGQWFMLNGNKWVADIVVNEGKVNEYC